MHDQGSSYSPEGRTNHLIHGLVVRSRQLKIGLLAGGIYGGWSGHTFAKNLFRAIP